VSLWFATVMGIVQGLTEFLPVSSTAHLRLTEALFHVPDDAGMAAFTAVIQLGTLLAVILYFAKELLAMARAIFVDRQAKEARLFVYLIAGTIPIGIAGILWKKLITGELRQLPIIAGALIAVALVMWLVDRNARQTRTIDDIRLKDALLIGAAQAFAVVPGVSRSGSTMSAALGLGLRREDAARFSFLLSIPAIGAAGVFLLPDAVHKLTAGGGSLFPLILSTAVSAVVGYLSIVWLLRYLRTRSFMVMILYRLAIGLLIFAWLFVGKGHIG